ncbi:MAG: hypothetical protein HWE14_01795 [Flavobacteriia bacterium]|nr:hypothetical protein [Flavobacteriia bacterium]
MNLSTWNEGIASTYIERPSIPHTNWAAMVTAVDFSSWYTSFGALTYSSRKGYVSVVTEWSGQSEWAVGWMGLQGGVGISENQRIHGLLLALYIPFSKAFHLFPGVGYTIKAENYRICSSLVTPLSSGLRLNLDLEGAIRITENWWLGNKVLIHSTSSDFSILIQTEGEHASLRFEASLNGQLSSSIFVKTNYLDYSLGIQLGTESPTSSSAGIQSHVEVD